MLQLIRHRDKIFKKEKRREEKLECIESEVTELEDVYYTIL